MSIWVWPTGRKFTKKRLTFPMPTSMLKNWSNSQFLFSPLQLSSWIKTVLFATFGIVARYEAIIEHVSWEPPVNSLKYQCKEQPLLASLRPMRCCVRYVKLSKAALGEKKTKQILVCLYFTSQLNKAELFKIISLSIYRIYKEFTKFMQTLSAIWSKNDIFGICFPNVNRKIFKNDTQGKKRNKINKNKE